MHRIWLCLSIVLLSHAPASFADVASVPATRDNTLYEHPSGAISNGAGTHIFTGTNAAAQARRAVLFFAVAESLGSGATINFVELGMECTRAADSTGRSTSLHRLTADWGEGTSDATGEEGGGAAATAGDATWLHTSYDTSYWTTPGGDFVATPSATATVSALGPYFWSSAGMVTDVQQWVDVPSSNHGWIVLGEESGPSMSKRFDSREGAVPPSLRIDYTPGVISVQATTWGKVKGLYR